MFDFTSSVSNGDWGITFGTGGGGGYGTWVPGATVGGYPQNGTPTLYPAGTGFMTPQNQQYLFIGLIVLAAFFLVRK